MFLSENISSLARPRQLLELLELNVFKPRPTIVIRTFPLVPMSFVSLFKPLHVQTDCAVAAAP